MGIGGRCLSRNVFFLKKFMILVGHEFTAVVESKHLDLQLGLFVHERLEFLEFVKALAFGLDWIEPNLP